MLLHQPLTFLFTQVKDLLHQLNNDTYTRPVNALGHATIGQHIRHIVELFQELENGYATGAVNYDHRKRNLFLQSDPILADKAVNAIINSISKADKVVKVIGTYSYTSDETITANSTYYRELIYNMEHTIHHMAYIRIGISEIGDIFLPAEFGVAPATTRHQKVCVQ